MGFIVISVTNNLNAGLSSYIRITSYNVCYTKLLRALDSIAGKQVNDHALRIEQIQSLSEKSNCNILFIGADELQHFAKEAKQALHHPLLTIADRNNFV